MPTNPTPTFQSLTLSGGTVTGVPNAVNPSDAVPFQQTFVASGASAAAGLVPSPGTTAGTTRFLREDATWATPAGGGSSGAGVQHLPPSMGANYGFVANSSSLSSTPAMTAVSGTVYYVPFMVDRSVTVTAMAFSYDSSTANTAYLGIYSDASNTPGSLLTQTSAISVSSVQTYNAAVTSVTLSAGTLYWAALILVTANSSILGTTNPLFALGSNMSSGSSIAQYTCASQASQSSLPATAGVVGQVPGTFPIIWFNG